MSGAPLWLRLRACLPGFAPNHLLREQLALIDSQSFIPMVGSWVAAVLLMWAFADLGGGRLGWAWWTWLGLYTLLLLGVYGSFYWSREHQMPARQRAWIMMLGMGLIGVFWGVSTTLVTLSGGDLPTLFMVTTIVAGIAAGVLGFCGPCWPVYVAHVLMVVPGVNIGFAMHGGPLPTTLGVFSLVYLVFMLQFARTVEQAALRAIQLRFDNRDLLAKLQTQTQVSDAARAQAEVAQAQAEANSIDKSRFLAAASHDLRQPIHAAGLFLEALGGTALDTRQRHIFSNVQAACAASCDMLNTLLDFSKLDAGVVQCVARSFSVQTLLADLEREYAPQAEAKGLVFRLRDTRCTAFGDPALVSLVLRNLISNAVRYTEAGGVLVACRRRGNSLLLEVWDSGIGIAPDQHQLIFKEFHQLNNSERDRTKGLGLGLAIVAGLAHTMATEVRVCSQLGRGSVFRLALPLGRDVVLDATQLDVSAMPCVQGLRVLVVDDDPVVCAAMQQLLTAWGCHCRCACDLVSALALAQQEPPQVLVTDYRLRAGLTGRDVVLGMRALLGNTLHCVIVTGDTAPDRLREAQDSSAVLLHKPLAAARLYRALLPSIA